jgi:hypothetical protein
MLHAENLRLRGHGPAAKLGPARDDDACGLAARVGINDRNTLDHLWIRNYPAKTLKRYISTRAHAAKELGKPRAFTPMLGGSCSLQFSIPPGATRSSTSRMGRVCGMTASTRR